MDEDLGLLTERFRRLGAPDPETWAASELHEDLPQTAAYVALRNLWPTLIDPWRDPEVLGRVPATRALLDAGVPQETVSRAMCLAAFEGVVGTLWELGGGTDVPEPVPEVRLIEVDESGRPTGREVRGLHESLLTLDPTGQDGADFL